MDWQGEQAGRSGAGLAVSHDSQGRIIESEARLPQDRRRPPAATTAEGDNGLTGDGSAYTTDSLFFSFRDEICWGGRGGYYINCLGIGCVDATEGKVNSACV